MTYFQTDQAQVDDGELPLRGGLPGHTAGGGAEESAHVGQAAGRARQGVRGGGQEVARGATGERAGRVRGGLPQQLVIFQTTPPSGENM